jgi:alcohol dehydrogenase class IV
MDGFAFARTPHIRFGAGRFSEVPDIVRSFGETVLLVTGKSFERSEQFAVLADAFRERSITWHVFPVSGEPSPDLVDRASDTFRNRGVTAVFAIGGGSVIDAGKAISAMLLQSGSVFDYLEGVGAGKAHDGRKVPFIAVPTTAGTGSEATRNSVLSRIGPGGFKKSIRHDAFVPDYAVVDPELALTCPPEVTAACGMDAFTQLLEAYVSTKASPMTDPLALSGMERVRDALVPAYTDGARSVEARAGLAYGALMSGIALANAGLGVVHGLASAIGGFFPIPHGVVCGVLLEPATRVTINLLQDLGPDGAPALEKYARVGRLITGLEDAGCEKGCELLLDKLAEWRDTLRIPKLSDYGVRKGDIDAIIGKAGSGNNPVRVGKEGMVKMLGNVIV